ncbi:TrkH family potassium uptake protein [Brotaphodocola catenula]|uniref:TrkH family potassium uptake protein n=1 Tax=Brotaphodocola catenula TaxID=2885361 RepID=A0AAE3DMC4_9FIRM|nr:TrkH family potassium uptake protein [Brotaphodocola catenula]MCC2165871.1 TrkH family potassium uptake protein [Brotaphodocola catenula]
MNIGIILYFLGWVLGVEGVLMLLPCAIALIFHETAGWYFVGIGLLCGVIGWTLGHKRPTNTVFYAKEGFVSVALSWIVLSLFGAMPFYLSREIPRFEDALFEVISGFTTTGTSILPDVEALSHCMLVWRSFTHWIGGMGVLVFLLAILPMASGYNMHIMRAESPGPSVGKLVPRVKTTAKILYLIYFAMTVIQMVLLFFSGMPWFDTLCISLGTAGTGGFGILNSSCGSYTLFQQAVITVFMILFGVNFNFYYLMLIKKPKEALQSEEVRYYFGIILVSALLIAWNIRGQFANIFLAFHHALFQVGSVITTTGFSTVDFDLWPSFAKWILVTLMFIGACAGSTGGGLKVSRVVIAFKTASREIQSLIHPRSIKVLKFEGKTVDQSIIKSLGAYLAGYFVVFFVSVLIVSLDNMDLETNFTAIAATFNNIGPGLAKAGPTCNFAFFSPLSKFVMMFDMLAGRLELFPMLVLFSPRTWRKE